MVLNSGRRHRVVYNELREDEEWEALEQINAEIEEEEERLRVDEEERRLGV